MDLDDSICEEIEEFLIKAQYKCGENHRTMDCLKDHAKKLSSFKVKVVKAEKESVKFQQEQSTSTTRSFELRDLLDQNEEQVTDKNKPSPDIGRSSSKDHSRLQSVGEAYVGAEKVITAEDRDSVARKVGTKNNSSIRFIPVDNLDSTASLQMSATSIGVKRGYDEVQHFYMAYIYIYTYIHTSSDPIYRSGGTRFPLLTRRRCT
jgi:hypothetical protein